MRGKLEQIKADLKRGRFGLANIKWLIETVEKQKEVIIELKSKNRFKSYMKMAEDNLALEEGLKRVQAQRDYYKKLFEELAVKSK